MCLSTLATATPADVAEAAPGAPRWFQLYVFRDRGVTRHLVSQAVDAGFSAIVLTVDAPRLGRRERDLRTGFRIPPEIVVPSFAEAAGGWDGATPLEILSLIDPALTWRDLEQLVEESPVPVVVKGIQTAEDARLACEHGAAALIVSNHGGRQLDDVARDDRPAAGGRGGGGGPDRGAHGRRRAARGRRREGARARAQTPCSPAERFSGASRRVGRRVRARCSSSSTTRSSSRSSSAAALRPRPSRGSTSGACPKSEPGRLQASRGACHHADSPADP